MKNFRIINGNTVVEIDSDSAFIVNAKASEKKIDDLFVAAVFIGTDDSKTA